MLFSVLHWKLKSSVFEEKPRLFKFFSETIPVPYMFWYHWFEHSTSHLIPVEVLHLSLPALSAVLVNFKVALYNWQATVWFRYAGLNVFIPDENFSSDHTTDSSNSPICPAFISMYHKQLIREHQKSWGQRVLSYSNLCKIWGLHIYWVGSLWFSVFITVTETTSHTWRK